MQKILDSKAFFLMFIGCRHLYDEIDVCEPLPSVWDGGLQSPQQEAVRRAEHVLFPSTWRPGFQSVPGGVCVLSGQGLALLASIPLNRLVTVHAQKFTSSLQLPQEAQVVSPGTGDTNRLDTRWRRRGLSGETHGSLINMASTSPTKRTLDSMSLWQQHINSET